MNATRWRLSERLTAHADGRFVVMTADGNKIEGHSDQRCILQRLDGWPYTQRRVTG